MACGASQTLVRLVDETGTRIATVGEQRTSRGSGTGVPEPFDCRPGADAGTGPCTDGSLVLFDFNLAPSTVYEVRFARADGSFTSWQRILLEIEEHTDPEFNGPGCPCTWYEAAPASVIVPADALRS
jgi:hypothetical protein